MKKRLAILLVGYFLAAGFFVLPAWTQQTTPATRSQAVNLPPTYDLRTVDAVTPIKQQLGGTCWTHGTMASIESNLLLSGKWKEMGLTGVPMISEYHLDWWNGFNKAYNEDVDDPAKAATGLTVHSGGDYKVAAAYISRGDGAVILPEGWDGADPKAWHPKPPLHKDPSYKRLYVRDIEFFTMGNNLEGIDLIKQQVMKHGAMGTANAHGRNNKDNIHYQPIDSAGDPNHSIAIIGWDDAKYYKEQPTPEELGKTRAPKAGAWLIKNSHGVGAGEKGFHWISYYDKHSARHPEMGAVTFRNIEPMRYNKVYYHDAHGWRDTLAQVSKAFNAYKASPPAKAGKGGKAAGPAMQEVLKAVSFYTSQHHVDYTVKVYGKYENGKLDAELASQNGHIDFCGYHTVDITAPIKLTAGQMFYICVDLSAGGHAFDRTSNIPVLLGQQQQQQQQKKDDPPQKKADPKAGQKKGGGGGGARPIVLSKAGPGESFYFSNGEWRDLYEYRFENLPPWAVTANVPFDRTANFCIKAFTVNQPAQ